METTNQTYTDEEVPTACSISNGTVHIVKSLDDYKQRTTPICGASDTRLKDRYVLMENPQNRPFAEVTCLTCQKIHLSGLEYTRAVQIRDTGVVHGIASTYLRCGNLTTHPPKTYCGHGIDRNMSVEEYDTQVKKGMLRPIYRLCEDVTCPECRSKMELKPLGGQQSDLFELKRTSPSGKSGTEDKVIEAGEVIEEPSQEKLIRVALELTQSECRTVIALSGSEQVSDSLLGCGIGTILQKLSRQLEVRARNS